MSKIQVVALERGHDGVAVRDAGEQFEVDVKRLKDGSTWFAPVDSAAAAEAVVTEERKTKQRKVQPPGAGPASGTKKDAARAPGAGPIPQVSDIA